MQNANERHPGSHGSGGGVWPLCERAAVGHTVAVARRGPGPGPSTQCHTGLVTAAGLGSLLAFSSHKINNLVWTIRIIHKIPTTHYIKILKETL